jgi:hypothetical protein
MQGLELTIRIPPARGEGAELVEFGLINITRAFGQISVHGDSFKSLTWMQQYKQKIAVQIPTHSTKIWPGFKRNPQKKKDLANEVF